MLWLSYYVLLFANLSKAGLGLPQTSLPGKKAPSPRQVSSGRLSIRIPILFLLLSEGEVAPISHKDSTFIQLLARRDLLKHQKEFFNLVGNVSQSTPISSFVANLNYTTVPLTLTLIPVSQLQDIDVARDEVAQEVVASQGRRMLIRVEVQCGDIAASVISTIPAPTRS